MEYCINGTGIPMQDGLFVCNSTENDFNELKNTFNSAKSRLMNGLKHNPLRRMETNVLSLEYDMVIKNGLRMLRQTCIRENMLKYPKPHTELLKTEKYYSSLATTLSDFDNPQVLLLSVEENYNNLHIIESTNLASLLSETKYYARNVYNISEFQYELFLKDVLVRLRFKQLFK